MLVNTALPALSAVLSLLDTAPFQFYLTGSRFFGHEKSESDWDYFVGKSEGAELRQWLMNHGYSNKQADSQLYITGDVSGAEEVWNHQSVPVQIQVVADAKLKSRIQDAMKENIDLLALMRISSKESRTAVWKAAHIGYSVGVEGK